MKALIGSTIPTLASLDITESVAFYTDKLGFKQGGVYDDYAIVVRDGCELHFWKSDDRHVAENTSCYIRTPDAQSLYDEFATSGVQLKAPVVQPWGMKELYVIDPHGNLLKFGEDTDA